MDLFDAAKVKELKEIMGDDFGELLDVYEQDSSQKLEELKAQLASKDFPAIKESAHAIKGASANLGIDYIAAQAKQMEEGAKASDYEPIESAYKVLLEVFPELKVQLAQLRKNP